MTNFGVSYSCFTETRAVEYSIEKLKEIYPDCPIYLVSDGGSDFSFLEKRFQNLRVSHEEDMRGWCQRKNDDWNTNNKFDDIYRTAKSLLDRNKAAVEFCKKPYMLMMEPDVLVRGKFEIPEGSILLGPQIVNFSHHNEFTYNWVQTLKNIPGSAEFPGWSFPYIYSSSVFDEVYEFVKSNDKVFCDFIRGDWSFGTAYDIQIPVLFAALGHKLKVFDEMIDCTWVKNWEQTSHPIMHAFRKMYPKENYTGRHAGETGDIY